MGLSKKVLR